MSVFAYSPVQPRFGSIRPLTAQSAQKLKGCVELDNGEFIVAQGRGSSVLAIQPDGTRITLRPLGNEFRFVLKQNEYIEESNSFNLEEATTPAEKAAHYALKEELQQNKKAVIVQDKGKLWLVVDGLLRNGQQLATDIIRGRIDDTKKSTITRQEGVIAGKHPLSTGIYPVRSSEGFRYVMPIMNDGTPELLAVTYPVVGGSNTNTILPEEVLPQDHKIYTNA